MSVVEYDADSNSYIFQCPHCSDYVQVLKTELACKIFRHGKYKNGDQVAPHLPKNECDTLVEQDLIYGCGKPFQISDDLMSVNICGYI